MTTTIILDLDNCISNDQWRIPQIRWDHPDPDLRYHLYHTLGHRDRPGNEDLFMDTPHQIIISTSRPVLFRKQTELWLMAQGIAPIAMFMRPNGNHMKSVDLKRWHVEQMRESIVLARGMFMGCYDDREDIVDMYISEGLPGIQRKIHDTCAYTPPEKRKR